MTVEWDRRQFVQLGLAAAATLALPAAAAPGSGSRAIKLPHVVLHDLAVPHAAHLAAALQADGEVRGIHGDPSSVWDELQQLRTQSAGQIHVTGITREAAPFCLRAMLGAEAQSLSVRRIDADLFVWTLQPVRA